MESAMNLSIPYYMAKVQKSMKHSFVSAALSLYYLERFYLFSSITKLIEVFLFDCSYVQLETELTSTGSTMTPLYSVVSQCTKTLREKGCMSLLLETTKHCISVLNVCPIPFISVIVSEATMVLRALFFNYSFQLVSMNSFVLHRYLHQNSFV